MTRCLLRIRPSAFVFGPSMLLICVISAGIAYGQLPRTQLTTIFPPGAKYGTEVDVKVSGADLDQIDSLFFSHPKITAQPKMSSGNDITPARPVAGQFTVQIAGSVPPGIYEARVVGRFGVSNPRSFVVGLYDETQDGGGNSQREKAKLLELDTTVNGYVDNNSRDYFKLPLKGGQRVLIDCSAQRIDSRMNGTLTLFDSKGKELFRSHDYRGNDPFIDFTAPQEGDYYLSLSDSLFRGGGEYFYRLTTHLGPHLDFVFPPSGLPGSSGEYTLFGRNLPGGKPSELALHGERLETLTVNVPLPGETDSRELSLSGFVSPVGSVLDSFDYRLNTSNPVTIYYADAEVTAEVEPNDDESNVQSVSAPSEIVGSFFPARDIDWVQFEAKKGQEYYIDLHSHRLGRDTDARMIVRRVTKNDKGEESIKELANVDDPRDRNSRINSDFDTSTDDPSYRLRADQDAIYRVGVWDQFGASTSDPRNVYRLVIREANPDFRLVVVPQALLTPVNANAVAMGSASVRKGGTTMFTVRVERLDGFNGEIEIHTEGLPAGVTTRGAWLGAADTTTSLVFEAREDVADWAGTARVFGKAKQGNTELVRYARGGSVVWGTGNRTQDPPAFRTTRDIALAVIAEPSPAWVEVGDEKVWETSRGGQLEIPVKVVRRRDFKGDLKLVATGLPKELKPADLTVKGDAGEAKLAVNATKKNTKTGVYTFYLRADTKAKLTRDADAVPAAEQEQKRLEALVKQLTEKYKTATQAQKAAIAAAEATVKAVGQSEQALKAAQAGGSGANVKEAEQALAEAKKKAQQAAEAKQKAEQAAKAAAAKLKQGQAAKTAADKQLAATKKTNAPKDFNFVTISTPVRLRIVGSPLRLTASSPDAAVKQGTDFQVTVNLERLYGFADKVELSLEVPKSAKGIESQKVSLEKDKATGTLGVKIQGDASTGEHTITVRARAKFNKIDVEATQRILVKVEAAS